MSFLHIICPPTTSESLSANNYSWLSWSWKLHLLLSWAWLWRGNNNMKLKQFFPHFLPCNTQLLFLLLGQSSSASQACSIYPLSD